MPPKLKFFIWECVHEMIPTSVSPRKRGMEVADNCPLCSIYPEAVYHLLRHYHETHNCLNEATGAPPSQSVEALSWAKWLKHNAVTQAFHRKHRIPMNVSFSNVTSNQISGRTDQVTNSPVRPIQLKIIGRLCSFYTSQVAASQPPLTGYAKLNTDGSSIENPGKEGLIRSLETRAGI